MEKSKQSKKYEINGDDFIELLKMLMFSSIGVFMFLFPVISDKNVTSPILYISDLIYLSNKKFIYLFVVFVMALFVVKNLLKKKKTVFIKLDIFVKLISILILSVLTLNSEIILFSDKNLEQIVREEVFKLVVVLPIGALFLPLILDYGLINILDGCIGKRFKQVFNTSGKNLLIIVLFLFVDKFLGFFAVYRLYSSGRLRNNEAINAILNYPILSFSINLYIAGKLNINKIVFTLSYLIVFIVSNFIISRIYPINKLSRGFLKKNCYKERYYRKNKLKMSSVNYLENRNKKSILSRSLGYFNESINIVSNMLPALIFSFLLFDFISRLGFFTALFTSLLEIFLGFIKIPNISLIAKSIFEAFFNQIYAIENMNIYGLDFTVRLLTGLIVVCQGSAITSNIVFIALYMRIVSIKDIFIVYIEKILIIVILFSIFYYCYLGISI